MSSLGSRAVALIRRRPERVIGWGIVAALVIIPLSADDPFQETAAALILLNAILGMSVTVLFGYAGQLSFAYAALYGVGAYVSTYSVLRLHVPQVAGVLLGGVGAVLVGAVIALPALRIRGLQLGLVTLAFSLAATSVFGHVSGYEGIAGIHYLRIGDFKFVQADSQLLLLAGVAVVAYLALGLFLDGRSGRRLLLLKADEASASSIGINVTRAKMMAFTVSSLILGLVGGLYPMLLTFLGPELYTFELVTTLFLIVIVGGAARLEGAILGATIFGLIRVLLKDQAQLAPVLYGGAMLLTLLLLPGGLIGLLTVLRRHPPRVSIAGAATPSTATGEADPDAPVLLRAVGVTKNFKGLRALDEAEVEVRGGEIVALIGSNGAGKSTLINAITGFIPPDTGLVEFAGSDVSRWSPDRRARLGLVRTFQFPILVPELSVRDNLLVAAESMGQGDHRKAVERVLELVGLADAADAEVRDLPFGMQKVVDLARAFVTRARLVLLDEPAAGLAPEELPRIASVLREFRRQGLSILVVEHNMSFVMPLADRVVVLDHGRVIATGTPAAISGKAEVIEAYLGQPLEAASAARVAR